MNSLGLVTAGLALAACSSSPANPDALVAIDAPAGFVPGPHSPAPAVPDQGGTPVLSAIKLVTIAFSDDPHAADYAALGDWVVTSSWWTAVGAEYGVGPGTHQHITLAATSPAAVGDRDITAFLTARIADGTLPARSDLARDQYLYEIYYPPHTVVDLAVPCSGFDDMDSQAYHSSVMGPEGYAYAVIPSCSLETLPTIEVGATHEIIEAATDPDPLIAPRFQFPSDSPWAGEVADQCYTTYTEGAFTATTSYSSVAALAGVDPCVPAAARPFFDATAVGPGTLAAGQSTTLTVQAWSTAETTDWDVQAFASAGYPVGFLPIVSGTVLHLNNDETAPLTVSVPAAAAHGAVGVVYLASIRGTDRAGIWPVRIVVP